MRKVGKIKTFNRVHKHGIVISDNAEHRFEHKSLADNCPILYHNDWVEFELSPEGVMSGLKPTAKPADPPPSVKGNVADPESVKVTTQKQAEEMEARRREIMQKFAAEDKLVQKAIIEGYCRENNIQGKKAFKDFIDHNEMIAFSDYLINSYYPAKSISDLESLSGDQDE
jgi:hypothetical protein